MVVLTANINYFPNLIFFTYSRYVSILESNNFAFAMPAYVHDIVLHLKVQILMAT